MAVSTSAYSSKEFYLAFAPETTMGTSVGASGTYTMLNIEDVPSVSHAVVQTLDVRGHSGRILHTGDVYTSDKFQMHTITASFVIDAVTVQALLENVTGIADTGSVTDAYQIVIPGSYTPPTYAHGATYSDNLHTFTVVIDSPEGSEDRVFVGCVVTELSIDMDSSAEGGRAKGSITFTTGYTPLDGADYSGATFTNYGSTNHYLYELNAVKKIGGKELVVSKFSLKISNPIARFGYQGSDADPEGYARAIPEIVLDGSLGVKYDAYTADLWEARRSGTTEVLTLSNNATTSSATFAFLSDYVKLTGDVQPTANDAGALVDLAFRIMSSGSSTTALTIQWPTA